MKELKITKRIQESEPKIYPAKAEGYLPLPDYVIPIRRTKIPAVDLLKMDFPNHDWNISGGWGYTQETAVVIEEDTYMHGLSMEGLFVRYRTYEELIVFQPDGQKFSGIEWKEGNQSLHEGPDGRKYDRIEYLVTAFTDNDWEMLKNDWESHDAYMEDPEGREAHIRLRRSKQIGFITICWFDVSRFFGKLR